MSSTIPGNTVPPELVIPESLTVTRGSKRITVKAGKGATVLHAKEFGWFRVAWFLDPAAVVTYVADHSADDWSDCPALLSDFHTRRAAAMAARSAWYAARRAERKGGAA